MTLQEYDKKYVEQSKELSDASTCGFFIGGVYMALRLIIFEKELFWFYLVLMFGVAVCPIFMFNMVTHVHV